MVHSMTGYGTVSLQQEGAALSVEIRTTNHRFLDLHVRLAREYGFLETEISQLVRETLKRGRVDVTVAIQAAVPSDCLINAGAARGYVEAAERLRSELPVEGNLDLKTLLSLPGVVQSQGAFPQDRPESGAEIRRFVLSGVRQVLHTVAAMRGQEGRALESEMLGYLSSIREKAAAIRDLMPDIVLEYHRRLEERLHCLAPQLVLDPQRLAQEVALLADKTDISEEISRLASHLDQYADVLREGREAGKKMDFLLQEMHREINTMLSKTGHLEVTRLGIAVKADIEKLREQAQNVE